jgi:small subunit ribosomal protein S17
MNKGLKQTRTLTGKVTSNRMDKTAVVSIERLIIHPKYNKRIKRHKRVFAHDADNVCQIGDKVIIKAHSRFSKRKSWELVEVIDKAAI